MRSTYTRLLSSFKKWQRKKWRQRLESEKWNYVISIVSNAKTHFAIKGIGIFESLLGEISPFACKKRFYIKKHLQRYKQKFLKTG